MGLSCKKAYSSMPGNEIATAKALFLCKDIVSLSHIGQIRSIEVPGLNYQSNILIQNIDVLDDLLSPDQSSKKADIYINGIGVSIKQVGATFAFNRLQRANIIDIFSQLNFNDPADSLSRLDQEVVRFHNGLLSRRNRPWENFFSEGEFKKLTEYLMMKGNPNIGKSNYPADLILESCITESDLERKDLTQIAEEKLHLYTFNEYFEKYKAHFKIAIRRSWIGQKSKSEHGRAVSLSKKSLNDPWVFSGSSGTPTTGWQPDFSEEQIKTVYYLMIEKTQTM